MPILAVLYLIIPGLQAWFFLNPATSHLTSFMMPPPVELANYILAVLCYQWMLANVIVAARIPGFQRLLPHDARIRFHILGTIGIAASLVYHAGFKLFSGIDIDAVSWSLLGLFAGLVSISLLWVPLPGFRQARALVIRVLRKGSEASYDLMKKAHNLIMLSLAALMGVHILQASVMLETPLVSDVLYVGSFALALGLFGWSKLRVRFLPRVTLSGIESSGEVRTLRFSAEQPLKYRAGQFAFIRFSHPDLKGEFHPFSFLSAPGEDRPAFGIRMSGDFTKALDRLRVGDEARINAGFGDFRPDARDRRKFCLVAAGVGAVPFISLLKELAARDDPRQVRLYIACRQESDIPELAVLKRLVADKPRFSLRLLQSAQQDPRYSAEFFRAELPDPAAWSFLVCASPGVRRAIVAGLRGVGVKGRRIRAEAFSLA